MLMNSKIRSKQEEKLTDCLSVFDDFVGLALKGLSESPEVKVVFVTVLALIICTTEEKMSQKLE